MGLNRTSVGLKHYDAGWPSYGNLVASIEPAWD